MAVDVDVILPIFLLLVPPLTLPQSKFCPFFDHWCRRYVAYFSAVGAALDTTANANAARRSAVGVGVMLPHLLLLVPPFTLRLGETLSVFVQPLV